MNVSPNPQTWQTYSGSLPEAGLISSLLISVISYTVTYQRQYHSATVYMAVATSEDTQIRSFYLILGILQLQFYTHNIFAAIEVSQSHLNV